MKNNYFLFVRFTIIIVAMLSIFTGCFYEKRISISYKYLGSTWNAEKDKLAFCRGYRIFKMPAGIAKFPDGGMSKIIHESISFYIYDSAEKKVSRFDFIENTEKCDNEFFWKADIYWSSDLIQYALRNRIWNDQAKVYEEKIVGPILYNARSREKNKIEADTKEINFDKPDELSTKEIDELLKNISFEEWGINPLDFCKINNVEYLNDIINLQGDSIYRSAILKDVVSGLDKKDVEKIILRIEKKKKQLETKNKYEYLNFCIQIEEAEKYLYDSLKGK